MRGLRERVNNWCADQHKLFLPYIALVVTLEFIVIVAMKL